MNRLASETSPYLLQHAGNPVEWFPWGDEALATARAEDRPILLSVGYAACHWCHVMAHESFEDPGIAAVMNELFVNIKVDREERPDIDAIYMRALHSLGEQGGWPLTMFLDSEARPFWGGTYFPPAPRYGRPGFAQVLAGIAQAYREKSDAVAQNVAQLAQALARHATREGGGP
ncbi:MAG TPA: thioredoxin domain-containing protein, partial [Gaiellaceae bacterium]|nr:thioredoxin domain-containing protein [Gaiellaceae bacterium]